MLTEAPPLLADMRASMAATHVLAATEVNGSKCWPYVAGRTQCAELKTQSSNRDSEPWRCAISGAILGSIWAHSGRTLGYSDVRLTLG